MTLPKRIAALEAAKDGSEFRVIFVSWAACDGQEPHRVAAEVSGQVVAEQEPGEGHEDFLGRVGQMLRADGTGKGLRVAFLRPLDACAVPT